MLIRKSIFALCAISTLVFSTQAQQLKLEIDAGTSRLFGEDFSKYEWGFSLGGDVLFFVTDNLLLGGRIGYNHWIPHADKFTTLIDSLVNGNVDGSANIVELLPSLRLTTTYPNSYFNVFGQAGAGLYLISDKITVNGTVHDTAVSTSTGSDMRARFGLQMAGGFSLGNPLAFSVDIYPAVNVIFNGDKTWQYFTINLGLSLGI